MSASIPPPAPSRPPRRDEIPARVVGVLKKGSREKADLLVVDVGEGPVVVKDFAAKPWWARVLGWVQIAREARAYRHVAGVPGVPAFLGRIDRLALALERVEGPQLAFAPDRFERGPEYVAKLRALVDRLHTRGLVHNDLRGRENVLVRPGGELAVVDLAGAILFRPGSLAHRWIYPKAVLADEAAFLKWKALLTPGTFTEEERRFLERFRRLRALWPFNRKPTPRGEA